MAVIAMGALPALLHGESASGRKRVSLSSSWSAAVCRSRLANEQRRVGPKLAMAAARTAAVAAPTRKRTKGWDIDLESSADEDSSDGKVLYELDDEEDEGGEDDDDDDHETENEDEEDGIEEAKERGNESELSIAKLGVADEIVEGLAGRGITELFPIQRSVFVPAMKGVDLIARAKTGTGKTLAFGIPIMDRIYQQRESGKRKTSKGPVALILAPTRELAKQVEQEFVDTAKDLATVCVYGGVSIISQKRVLAQGVDIAVGTPGRIIDLIEQGCLDLKNVQYMVLDEADRMLAVGFDEDVERIMEELPEKRQNMLFSATIPSWVQQLSRKFLKKPLTIDLVGEKEEKLAEGIKLFAVQTSRPAKRQILSDVITVYGKGGKTIVFTETKRDAEEVCLAMNRSLGCESLHGDIAQFQREKTLGAFREGKFLILVATDVAARGLDIDDVDLVIHYDLPRDSETFVHRSGRTGRAGKAGTALVLYAPEQKRTLKQIERDVSCRFDFKGVPVFEDVLNSSTTLAVELIKSVDPELQAHFSETAQKLIDEQGVSAFASALAHMSGFSQRPSARSLLTLEPGFMTLKFTRGEGKYPLSTRQVMGAVSSIYQKAADNMGKIQMIDERNVEGAVFDLPEDIAKELLAKSLPADTKIETIKVLPSLQASWEDERPSYYGRSSGGGGFRRGSFGRGGGSFNGGGRGSFNSRLNSRSGEWGDRGGSSYSSRGGRSSSSSDNYAGARSSSDNYEGGRSYSDNYAGARGKTFDQFPGACYKCGKPGHRSYECGRQ